MSLSLESLSHWFAYDSSYRLKLKLERKGERTSYQAAQLQEARTSLLRLIHRLRADQEIHMPRVSLLFDSDESTSSHTTKTPESIKLYLPSDLDIDDREAACSPALLDMETKLRFGGMSESLDELRHQLRFRTHMNKFKIKNITGQRPNTRARGIQARIEEAIKRAVETYRQHRAAYLRLVGPGEWEAKFRVLQDDDVRGLGDRLINEIDQADEERVREFVRSRKGVTSASGESRYRLPWIWYNVSSGLEGDKIEIGDGEPT